MHEPKKTAAHDPLLDPRMRADAFLRLAAPLLVRLADSPAKDADRRDRFMASVEQIRAIADGRFYWHDDEGAPEGCRGPAHRLGPSHGPEDLRLVLINEAASEAKIDEAVFDAETERVAADIAARISIWTDYMATLPKPPPWRGHPLPTPFADGLPLPKIRPLLYDDIHTREVSPAALGPADEPLELDTDAMPPPPPISPEAVLVAAATYIDEAEAALARVEAGRLAPASDDEQRTLEDQDAVACQPLREAITAAETVLMRAAVRIAPVHRWPGRPDQRRRDRAMILAREAGRTANAAEVAQARIANGLQEIPHTTGADQ